MDSALKRDVVRKARRDGLTLTGVFNIVARAYATDKLLITVLERDVEQGLNDIRYKRVVSQKTLEKRLGLRNTNANRVQPQSCC